jgi:hypothetical protein
MRGKSVKRLIAITSYANDCSSSIRVLDPIFKPEENH